MKSCCYLAMMVCVFIPFSVSQENIIDQWADTIIDIELGPDSLGVAEDILGAIDKPGQSETGYVALGGGWVEVDMGFGEEIEDGPGVDFIVHEAGENEGLRVLGKNTLEEDWVLIGENSRRFDLEGSGLSTARFLRIEDQGSTLDGADVEAIEAYYYPNDPWADHVVSLDIDPDFVGGPNQNSIEVIGPPNSIFVSLPFSTMVVQFTDNSVFDGPGDDLFIAEVGGGGESAIISVSADGVNWTELGIADNNSTTSYDLANFGITQPIVFVRIEGLDAGGASPGFDADAVFALPNSIGAPVDPGTLPDPNAIVTITDTVIEVLETIEMDGVPMYPDGYRPLGFETGDTLIALGDRGTQPPLFNRLMLYSEQAEPGPVLLVNSPSAERSILSLFWINTNQIGLVVGPSDFSNLPDTPYYFIRLQSMLNASGVQSFSLH